MAIAPIRPLAWEAPYAIGVALEKDKKPKKKKKKILVDIFFGDQWLCFFKKLKKSVMISPPFKNEETGLRVYLLIGTYIIRNSGSTVIKACS